MRLRSDIWVKAYIRSCATAGAHAVVVRHGDDQAGSIYIKIAHLNGNADVYGPAPAGLDAVSIERRWVQVRAAAQTTEAQADALLRREAEFDPDVWIVEVEDRDGRSFLGDWLQVSDT
ncbi:MAG: DUF1491 family protein [Hyphomicrobiaceae bacterium]|nr:DUF1491 family protein [Hyphomicrobiaceae bacterium]